MLTRIVLRITAIVGAVLTALAVGAVQAFASDPREHTVRSSISAPPAASPAPSVPDSLPVNWALVVALAVAALAVAGLVYSLARRRGHRQQPA